MHKSAHSVVMLKESQLSPSEADRSLAVSQHGIDEDKDQTGLTYLLLMNVLTALYTFQYTANVFSSCVITCLIKNKTRLN